MIAYNYCMQQTVRKGPVDVYCRKSWQHIQHTANKFLLLEERVPAVSAGTPKMGRQKKELQNWRRCYHISLECFKKPLAYGKNN